MMKTFLLAATAVSIVAAVPAYADTFTYSNAAVNQGQNVTVSGFTSGTFDTGQIVLTGSGPNAGQTFDAWCVDVLHTLLNSSTYNIVPLTTAGSGGGNPALTAAQINQMGSLMIAGNADVLDDKFGIDTSPAFQLAIWAVEYGGTLLNNANGPLASLTQTLVNESAAGGILNDPNATVDLLDAAPGNQVLAFGVDATPIPATAPLFAGGLGLIAWLSRRRRRANSSQVGLVLAG